MSLFGAMTSGVSGLAAQSSAMGAIADNITNVNTVGYKNTKTDFQSLVTKQTSATSYSTGGVQARPLQLNDVQGLLQRSASQTDLGVSGVGYFVVNGSSNPSGNSEFLFTRAGSFSQDNEGFLRNTAGYYLQGWPTDPQGNVTLPRGSNAGRTNENIISTDFLQTVNLSRVGGTASPTSEISIGANLPSRSSVGDTHKMDVQLFDSLGTANGISFEYEKVGANEWNLKVEPPAGAAVLNLYNDENDVQMSIGHLEFTGVPKVGSTFTLQPEGGTPTVFKVVDTGATGTVGADGAIEVVIDSTSENMNMLKAVQEIAIAVNGVYSHDPDVATVKAGAEPALLLHGFADHLSLTVSDLAITGNDGNSVVKQSGDFTVLQTKPSEPSMIKFGANGLPETFNVATMSVSGFVNGAADLSSVTLDFGTIGEANGMTQFGADFTLTSVQQNGARYGEFSGVTIGSDGLVTALFDNGEMRPIYKIPLATFANPNGLESRSGNVWTATQASGNPLLGMADQGPVGEITQSTLEASTVDIAKEFTDMIVVQRAYSAATKIISTADEMLEELGRLKR